MGCVEPAPSGAAVSAGGRVGDVHAADARCGWLVPEVGQRLDRAERGLSLSCGNGVPAATVAHRRAPEHATGRGRAATCLCTLSTGKWLK